MSDEMNRKTACGIAETIRPWSSTNDCKELTERIFTALQIAEKRGGVVSRCRLAKYRRAVDAFCDAESKLPMARWVHAPAYVKALFALRSKPGKGKA